MCFVFEVSNLNKVNGNANPVSVDSTGLETDKLGDIGYVFTSYGIDLGESDTVQKEELKFRQGVGEPCLNEMPAQNYSTGGAALSFGVVANDQADNEYVQAGKVGLEFELSDEMKKLNIKNVEKGAESVSGEPEAYTGAEDRENLKFTNGGLGVASTNSGASITADLTGQESDDAQFHFISSDGSSIEEKFAFAASLPAQQLMLSLRRQPRDITTSESMDKHGTERIEEQESESALSAAKKACDKWRKRGNEAYEKGELSKAEDFYTWGVNCVPPDDTSTVAFRPLVRYYSNCAATRMALRRVREAMQDCLIAIKLDPTFHRAHIRAAK
ncbi:hypothetical protein Cgig2_027881 [Carnegiea gigantea]|uniref:Uncharacterized protein n=1 Tax=Carnegiea gigantea TaxID=171969 RepID=A0A9Q1QMR8_9CARY|nr:hypothetical protein Cgig2_027881 [Carnegiea gigantea]